jgi:hypothetical protein
MPDAHDIHGTVFKNGSATLLARVVGAAGTPIARADVASIRYTVYLLDHHDPDRQMPLAGHIGVPLAVAEAVYDIVQIDALWTRDTVGYNFKHVLDVSSHQAFPTAGRGYRIVYEIAPTNGQVILLRFRVHAI